MSLYEKGRADAENGIVLTKEEFFCSLDDYKKGYLSVLCENIEGRPFCEDEYKDIEQRYDFPFVKKFINDRRK